jgi:neurocan core protein
MCLHCTSIYLKYFSHYRKDESKGPIVEVRTEEERTPNHEGGGPTEPNETTPLTEPE